MSKFDSLSSEAAEEPKGPPFHPVEDSMLVCQSCREFVSEGKYFPTLELLTWECSQGHKSFLKDFVV